MCSFEEAIENIDIGGPTLLRSAAKNHAGVGVVVDRPITRGCWKRWRSSGGISDATRFALAKKVFAHTAAYDGAIANYLTRSMRAGGGARYPDVLSLQFARLQDLRYGENPHQSAAFYRDERPAAGSLATYPSCRARSSPTTTSRCRRRLGMREELHEPALRHRQARQSLRRRYRREPGCGLREGIQDHPVSAFGGILAFNRALDRATAEAASKQFAEVIHSRRGSSRSPGSIREEGECAGA